MNQISSKIIFLCTFLSFVTTSFAQEKEPDPVEIKRLAREIRKKREEYGRSLVLVNFVNAISESKFSLYSNEYIGSKSTENLVSAPKKLETDLYAVFSPELTLKEKEERIQTIFLELEKNTFWWLSRETNSFERKEKILQNFENVNRICTEDMFSDVLKDAEISFPSLAEYTDLTKDVSVDISMTYGEDGQPQGGSASSQLDEEAKKEEVKAAVSSASGALSGMVAHYVITGSIAGPYGAAAGAVAAGVAIAVKIVWDASDMRKHNKQMKKILAANQELFDSLKLDEIIRSSYMKTCHSIVGGYRESSPYVRILLSDNTTKQEKADSYNLAMKELENLGDIGKYSLTDENADVLANPVKLNRFFKYHLLSSITSLYKNLHDQENQQPIFVENYFILKEKIYSTLEQVFLMHLGQGHSSRELSFKKYYLCLQDLQLVKGNFQEAVFTFMDTKDFELKQSSFLKAQRVIMAYQNGNKASSEESDRFLKMAEEILEKMYEELY